MRTLKTAALHAYGVAMLQSRSAGPKSQGVARDKRQASSSALPRVHLCECAGACALRPVFCTR
jgi:hypothetical protein